MKRSIILLLLLSLAESCKKAPTIPKFGLSKDAIPENNGGVIEEEDPIDEGGETVDDPSENDPPETIVEEPGTGTEPVEGGTVDPPPMVETPDAFDLLLEKMEAKAGNGQDPVKGETTVAKLSLKNNGKKAGKIKVTPWLTAKNYSDFGNIRLPTREIDVGGMESKVLEIKIEPFFREEGGKREYAMNRGGYNLRFDVEGDLKVEWKEFSGKDFNVANSNAVFTAVYWSQPYLDKARYKGSIADWMRETFTRKGKTSNGNGLELSYNKGFDEMMGVRTMFRFFDNWRPDQNRMDKILEQVIEAGKDRLGLKQNFSSWERGHPDNHGYDMEIGLTENGFGGLAWLGWNSQASGIFDGDTSVGRAQMIVIHETGHNYGAPHCDPIQGFVMCSGEKHNDYIHGGGWFVWHDVSIADMKKNNKKTQAFSNSMFEAIPGSGSENPTPPTPIP